jgi:hypothetical protein
MVFTDAQRNKRIMAIKEMKKVYAELIFLARMIITQGHDVSRGSAEKSESHAKIESDLIFRKPGFRRDFLDFGAQAKTSL